MVCGSKITTVYMEKKHLRKSHFAHITQNNIANDIKTVLSALEKLFPTSTLTSITRVYLHWRTLWHTLKTADCFLCSVRGKRKKGPLASYPFALTQLHQRRQFSSLPQHHPGTNKRNGQGPFSRCAAGFMQGNKIIVRINMASILSQSLTEMPSSYPAKSIVVRGRN